MARIPDDYCTMFAEAITVLDEKFQNQNEAQSTQALEIAELKRKVSALYQQDHGTRISNMVDIATKVSVMKLDDKIEEGYDKLQLMHKTSQIKMNTTIAKNGKESKDQRDEIKLLASRLEKRINELVKDSNKIQKATESVNQAMKELEALELKIIEMLNGPDSTLEPRIKHLEAISKESVESLSRIEFFTYLDEFKSNNNEIVEKLVEDGIKESYKKLNWGLGYDDRNNNPTYRRIEVAKRSASIRACSENVSARIRTYSENACARIRVSSQNER